MSRTVITISENSQPNILPRSSMSIILQSITLGSGCMKT